jgi:hypothetical protein
MKNMAKKILLVAGLVLFAIVLSTVIDLLFKVKTSNFLALVVVVALLYYPVKGLIFGGMKFRRAYYLFWCKVFFSRSHQDIDFSSFSGGRLQKIIRLNARRRDLDAPRLSDDELTAVCAELDRNDLALVGKAVVGTGKLTLKGLALFSGNGVRSTEVPTPVKSGQKPAPVESSTSSPKQETTKPLFEANNVVALSGAVVTSYQDGMIKYKFKCESCGALDGDEHYTQAPRQGAAFESYKTCHKCNIQFKAVIKAS